MRSVFNTIAVIKDWLFRRVFGWMVSQIFMQHERAFLWSPVIVAIGVIIYFLIPYEPKLILSVGIFSVCIMALIVAISLQAKTLWRLILIGALLIGLGFMAGTLRTNQIRTPLLQDSLDLTDIRGYVDEVEWLDGNFRSARLLVSGVEVNGLTYRFRLTFRSGAGKEVPRYYPGDLIEGLASVNPSSAAVVPGGFNFRRHMFFKRIGGLGFFYGAPRVVGKSEDRSFISLFSRKSQALRNAVNIRVLDHLTDKRLSSVVAALLTGQRGAIMDTDMEAMRGSGLAHMLAISGLHIGLFSASVFFVLRLMFVAVPWCSLHLPVKGIVAVVSLAAAGAYMVLAGASVPTQRAVLMIAVVFMAILIGRHAISMRLAAFAALCVLLLAPESLLSVSFQLSFAAVVALIAVYDALRPCLSDFMRASGLWRKAVLYFGGVVLTSMIASVATAPFALYHFNSVALYGVLANAIAMPVMAGLIMPCAVLALFLMPFGLEALPLQGMERGVEFVLWAAHEVSSLEYSRFTMGALPAAAFLSFVAGGLWLCLVQGRLKILGLIGLFLGFIQVAAGSRQPDILVAQEHKLWGIWTPVVPALYVSSLQKGRFDREAWEQHLTGGDVLARHWRVAKREGDLLSCDESACRISLKGKNVSFVKAKAVLVQECDWADVVVSVRSVKFDCPSRVIVDHAAVKNYGAHFVYLDGDTPYVESVGHLSRGSRRPWH